jgi:hypothetical protein
MPTYYGFIEIDPYVDVTPGNPDVYEDVDITAHVGADCTGAVLRVQTTNGDGGLAKFRKNGSTDDFSCVLHEWNHQAWVYVGVDGDDVFEAYVDDLDMDVILCGYTDSRVIFNTDAVDVSPAGGDIGSWADVDITAYTSSPTGAIILLVNTHAADSYSAGIRKNGSTDTMSYGLLHDDGEDDGTNFAYQLCGVDGDDILEINIENASVKAYLVGYTQAPVTWKTDGIAYDNAKTWTWEDQDVTGDTSADATYVILWRVNTNAGGDTKCDVRSNGSAENHMADGKMHESASQSWSCGLDVDEIFENNTEAAACDTYLLGWCAPLVAGAMPMAMHQYGHIISKIIRG